MITAVLTDNRIAKGAAITLALVLHVFLLIAFFNLHWPPIQVTAQREIEVTFQL
jgi:hypothetical protein